MSKSLLYMPDLSGFTEFVHSTEVEHSQHVIAEILEVLIDANILEMELAEIEGDALFFYKEDQIPTSEDLLAQFEHMYQAFNNHLKEFKHNTICPCNACAIAPNLELKIVVHIGELQFIVVKNARKPFGKEVIQIHRLLKNKIPSNSYVLISDEAENELGLSELNHPTFNFLNHSEEYDFGEIKMKYSTIDLDQFPFKKLDEIKEFSFEKPPSIKLYEQFAISAKDLYEYISNFKYRQLWTDGIDELVYNAHEVNKVGTEHLCVVKSNQLNFVTITRKVETNQLVYGELTSAKFANQIFNYFIITPIGDNNCELKIEVHFKTNSFFQRILVRFIVKRVFKKNIKESLDALSKLVNSKINIR